MRSWTLYRRSIRLRVNGVSEDASSVSCLSGCTRRLPMHDIAWISESQFLNQHILMHFTAH